MRLSRAPEFTSREVRPLLTLMAERAAGHARSHRFHLHLACWTTAVILDWRKGPGDADMSFAIRGWLNTDPFSVCANPIEELMAYLRRFLTMMSVRETVEDHCRQSLVSISRPLCADCISPLPRRGEGPGLGDRGAVIFRRIHVTGAAGAGVTSLGAALAER